MEDLTGRIFGNWKVNEFSHIKGTEQYWKCTCLSCNRDYTVLANTMKRGTSKRCRSCAAKLHPEIREKATKASMKSGLSTTKLYQMLANMHRRCEVPTNRRYESYGARGIKVCPEWSMEKVRDFYNWAMANGYREGLEIDRIDVNGDYEPSNCRFVTKKENERNRRNNRIVSVYGEQMTLAEAVERYSEFPYSLVLNRIIKYGYSVDEALTKPKRHNAKRL